MKTHIFSPACLTVCLLCGLGSFNGQSALVGPDYPAPGGNTLIQSGRSWLAGGMTWTYGIINPAQYSAIYSGPSAPDAFRCGLDYTLNILTFDHAIGTEAVWTGTTHYSATGLDYPTRLVITMTGLGPSPWVTGSSVGRPDVAILANLTSVATYSANLRYEILYGDTFIPLGDVPTSDSRASLGFYSAPVPEPSTYVAGVLMLLPFGFQSVRYLRRRQA